MNNADATGKSKLDRLPLTSESEAKIRENAADALACLRRFGALDVAEALGIGGAA